MAAPTGISIAENVSTKQLDEQMNNSYGTHYQSDSVVKSEPLDGESFIEPEGVADNFNEDTNILQRTYFGLQTIEPRCFDEKIVSLKKDELEEDFSATQHVEVLEEENGNLNCNICGNLFTKITELRKHMKIHKESFQCSFCERCFFRKSQLQTHMKTHNRNTFECAFCEKTFKTKNNFHSHMDILHSVKSCDICGRQVSGTQRFKYHTLAHEHEEKSRDFRCDTCGEVYKTVDSFLSHLERHKNVAKPYTCEICGQSFAVISRMGFHMLSHQDHPLNTNRSSDTSSKSNESQNDGESTLHNNNTSFVYGCELCDETFSSQLVLETHYESHKTECIECEQCQKTFDTGIALEMHVESAHKTHRDGADTRGHQDSSIRNGSGHTNLQMSDLNGDSFGEKTKSEINCNLCGEFFSTKLKLNRHLEKHQHEEKKCIQGKETFETEESLKRHIDKVRQMKVGEDLGKHDRVEHINKKLNFNCDVCGKQFSGLNGLKIHMRIHVHVDDKKYSCEKCGKRFVHSKGLEMHMRFHQQSISCDTCGRFFSRRSILQSHMKIHLRTVFPKCELCNKSFKTKVVLQRHIRTFHSKESCDICGLHMNRQLMGNHKLAHAHESKSKDFICSVCEDIYKTAESFRTHLVVHKDNDRPFICEVCGKAFITIKGVRDHSSLHRDCSDTHQDSEVSDKSRSTKKNLVEPLENNLVQKGKSKLQLFCDFCGKTFSRKDHLKSHLRIHQNVEKKCNQCGIPFKREISLENHMDLVHSEKICDICGQKMPKGELKRHRAEHITKKQFKCDVCNKQFSRHNGLKVHMRVHVNVDDKKYSCEKCGKRFVHNTGLEMHMRFHQKSISCDRCGRCFSRWSELQSHMKVHLRTVFPKCELCDKSFKTKVVLQRHIRTYHSDETCDICGLQMNRKLMGNHRLAHAHESKSKDFICSVCEDIYKTAESFRTHLEIHKDNDRPYPCEVCGKAFITIKGVRDHSSLHRDRTDTHHNSEVSDKSRSTKKNLVEPLENNLVQKRKSKLQLICDFCGKIFSRKDNLESHLRIHQTVQNVEKKCDQCGIPFKRDISLKNHMDLVHSEKICDICGQKMPKGELKRHRAEHITKKQFKCDVCDKQFSRHNGLKIHMRVHVNVDDKKYSCEKCGKRFVHNTGLEMHMRFHQKSISCDRCGHCFSRWSELQSHMKVHLRTVFPKCELCDRSFKTKVVLQKHIHNFHSKESCDICGLQMNRQLMGNHKLAHAHESKSKDFICSVCGDIYKTAESFRTHLEIHKDDDRPYVCEVCGKTFIKIKIIHQHSDLHRDCTDTHQDSEVSDKSRSTKQHLVEPLENDLVQKGKSKLQLICDFCGKIFSRKYNLERHLGIHQNDQNVEKKCDQCGIPFKSEISLKNHIDLVHNEKLCDICGQKMPKGELKRHRAEHITKKKFKCDVCDKQFSRHNGLKIHMRVHVNVDDKKSCEMCGKRFVHNRGLEMHMRFHQKSISCDTCGRCFSRWSELQSHMKVHLRTVFPKCEICNKSFKTKVVLQRHIHTFHSKESCDICGLQLNRQLRGMHKLAHEYESNSWDFVCSICEDWFKTAESFRTHLEIHKDDDRPYSCELCGKSFIAVKSVRGHAHLHRNSTYTHQASESFNENDNRNKDISESRENSFVQKTKLMFQCDLCGKIFSAKHCLQSHIQTHQCEVKKCDKCEKTFKSEIALLNHIDLEHKEKPCEVCGKILTKGKLLHHRAEHINKKLYQCDVCGKQFSGLKMIKKHMNDHVNGKKYSCEKCGKRFVYNTSLKKHMKFHQQSICCNKCGRCFSDWKNLQCHMKIHQRTVFPKCELCDKSFKTKIVLQRHQRTYHSDETCDICGLQMNRQLMGNHKLAHEHENNSQDFICSVCEESYKTAENFRSHLEIHKDDIRPYTCEVCGKAFFEIKSVRDHTWRSHRERSKPHEHPDSEVSDKKGSSNKNLSKPLESHCVQKGKSVLICNLCGKTFSRKDSLDLHLRIHQNVQNVEKKCDHCGKTFRREISLKNHIDLVHTEKLCDICGQVVPKGELQNHRAKHINKKQYKCDVCDKQFLGRNGLKIHMRVHVNVDDKKYSCEKCGKRFVHSKGLEIHMKFHQKSISCDKCGRFFSQWSQLQSHMKVHLRTVFPKCELCERSFKTKTVLDWHLRAYHTSESCDICGHQMNRQLMGNHKLAHAHESKSKDFICSVCEDIYKTAESFRTHLEVHKDDDRPYTCEVCGKPFLTVLNLKTHARVHKDGSDTPKEPGTPGKKKSRNKTHQISDETSIGLKTKPVFPCDVCGKVLKTEKYMQKHINNVHKLLIPCDICGEKFTPSQISTHKKIVHPTLTRHSKKPQCVSGKTALSTHKLRLESKTDKTVSKQKYKCRVCGRHLRSKLHLRNHYMQHKKLKKAEFKCEVCALKFTSIVKRDAHFSALHSKTSCNICQKTFLRVLLKGHRKLHEPRGNTLISRGNQQSYRNPKAKRGHMNESIIPFLRPREINVNSLLIKKTQFSKLSPDEKEILTADKNFFNCVLRKVIGELGITTIKGDNFTKLKSKMKDWVLNVKFDKKDTIEVLKRSASLKLSYNKQRKLQFENKN